jgi:hypothetical protein
MSDTDVVAFSKTVVLVVLNDVDVVAELLSKNLNVVSAGCIVNDNDFVVRIRDLL